MENVVELRIRLIRDRLTAVEALLAEAMPIIAQLKAERTEAPVQLPAPGMLALGLYRAQRKAEKMAAGAPLVPFTDLKRLLLAAADLREQSWRPPFDVAELPARFAPPPASKGEYRLSESEAADLACQLLKIDPSFALPVSLLLFYARNDILEWAGDHGGRVPEVSIPEGFAYPSREPPPAAA